MKNFKRKKVEDQKYFRNLVYYIHHNPIKARLSEKLCDYRYSSYRSIINDYPDFILQKEIIDVFDGLNNFINFHEKELMDFEKTIMEK